MKKEKIIFFIILALAVAALVLTGTVWAAIVTAMLLIYLILSIILRIFSGRKMNFSLHAESQIRKGEEAALRLEAKNESLLPVLRCDAVLKVTNLLNGTCQEELLRFGVFAKKKKVIELTGGDNCCGVLRYTLESAKTLDPFGLFARTCPVEAAAETLIEPKLEKESLEATKLEHYDMESFRYADQIEGTDSSETIGIREYEAGDSVRAVHWKLSAKTGELLVKQYGYPIDTRILLLADKQVEKENLTPEKIDRLTEYTLGISLSMADAEIGHTFGWLNTEAAEYESRLVNNREDLYRLLPDYLRAPVSITEGAPAVPFLESGEENHYSSYLYVTDEKEKQDQGLEKLKEFGYVTVLAPEKEQSNMD